MRRRVNPPQPSGRQKDTQQVRYALQDPDYGVRINATEALRETTSERAVSVLVKLLKDEVTDVRAYAAEALGKIGSPEAIISMTQALMDKHWYVR